MNKLKAILNNSPWMIAAVYIIIGFIWIQFSDRMVLALLDDPDSITQVQSYKGWFFVTASALLIFFLIRTSNNILNGVFQDLQKANNKFKATIEHAPVGIAHHRPDEKWLVVNQTLCELLGYSREELTALDFSDFIHPDDLQKGRQMDRELISGGINSYSLEKRYIRKDGSQFYGMVRKSAVDNGKNEPLYLIVVLEDITREKEYENEMKNALNEKEILLSEVHHRVKNNLALISALFDLENIYTSDGLVHEILNKSKIRIKCLAMIHETFSNSVNTANIQFDKFLHELVDFLSTQLLKLRKKDSVEVDKDFSPVQLNINQAIPVSLILTELMVNAGPGKFKQVEKPIISVSMKEDSNSVTLNITDNGAGLFDKHEAKNTDTLTFTIVQALVTQINGVLESHSERNETAFTLTFEKSDIRGPGSNIIAGRTPERV